MPPLTIFQGDTYPLITATLTYGANIPIYLLDCRVVFCMESEDRTVLIEGECKIVNAQTGEVSYQFKPNDTAKPGNYLCSFRILYDDGRVITIPNSGYIELTIYRALKR